MRNVVTAALAVALAACGSQPANEAAPANDSAAVETNALEPVADDARVEPAPADPDVPEPAADEPADTANATIPAALRGRWGLVQADCTSTRGDAKGLLTISDTQLRFYESRGTLRDIAESDASRLVADFDFMGEGQTWQRRMILDAQDGGETLIRREQGADAMAGPLRYRKCDA